MSTIADFAAAHFDYNGLSPDRRRDVLRALESYAAFAGKPLEQTDADDFGGWLRSLVDGGLDPNTVRKYGNCVRPWYRWAWRDARLIDADIYLRVKEVPNPRGATANAVPRPYKRKELDGFWREFDAAWPTKVGERAWPRFLNGTCGFARVATYAMHVQVNAIVHLALHCGMRRSEIRRVTIDDLHPDNEYVVVRGAAKGNGRHGEVRFREVPMTVDTRAAIAKWLAVRKAVIAFFGAEHDSVWLGLNPRASLENPLLPSTPAAPMNDRRFGELMSTIGAWELHRFRHTCGTEWLRAGMALEQVKELLGHTRIQQTLAYAHVAGRDVVRGARKAETKFVDAVRRPVAA